MRHCLAHLHGACHAFRVKHGGQRIRDWEPNHWGLNFPPSHCKRAPLTHFHRHGLRLRQCKREQQRQRKRRAVPLRGRQQQRYKQRKRGRKLVKVRTGI